MKLVETLTAFIGAITALIVSIKPIISFLYRMFKSGSDSDADWKKISPTDYTKTLSLSSSLPSELNKIPKGINYLYVINGPIIIGDVNMVTAVASIPALPNSPNRDSQPRSLAQICQIANLGSSELDPAPTDSQPSSSGFNRFSIESRSVWSFSLDESTRKKCLMVGARGLSIAWGDLPQYWKWISLPESRFSQVAKLERVWWLHAIGKFESSILSPHTTYEAFFVFKLSQWPDTFKDRPVQLYVHFEGRENKGLIKTFLDPSSNSGPLLPRERRDGWKEIKMGEFFNRNGKDGSVWCHIKEVTCDYAWSGLIIEGIEVRPKS